jgi:hypothetical protein
LPSIIHRLGFASLKVVLPAALLMALAVPGSAGAASNVGFASPGSYSFTVPSNVSAIRISASGAGGGTEVDCAAGGKGGNVQAAFPVTAGAQLSITVAGQGGPADETTGAGGAGGFGGGASGGTAPAAAFHAGGGGGGGASRVSGSAGLLVVAAGGGGCGAFGSGTGTADGGNAGAPGHNGSVGGATGGGPGTQSAGGAGGQSANVADPGGGNGSSGQGGAGAGAATQNGGGGGGGGGYFGGGGGGAVRSGEGAAGGGGGGSNFAAPGASGVTATQGASAANGQVTISYIALTAPAVKGKTEVGRTLTVTPGTASAPGSISFQWLRGSGSSYKPITGATGTTYKLKKADRAKRVKVVEAVSDTSGVPASAGSAPTGVVGPPIPRTSAKKTQRVIKQKGLVVKVRSNLAASLTATGTIALPKGAAKVLRLKRLKRSLKAGKLTTLKLKLSSKGFASLKRALPGHKLKAKLVLTLKDKQGGKATKKLPPINLKR